MLIDWFTVSAQALNFLVLVWLLRRILYKPILNAIDAREKLIAVELSDAAAKKAEAQKERDEFQHKNDEFDEHRAALLTKATYEAKAERQRLIEEARKAADTLNAKRQEALRNEAKNLNDSIARRTQEEVFSIARKVLTDLAGTSLEERMVDVFTRRLRKMDGKAKEALGAGLKTAAEPPVLRSAIELPADERAKIQRAINETFSADIHLRFETAPDRIGGLELNTNGQKVGWSIADYLTLLEKGVSELLKQHDKPDLKPTAKPGAKSEQEPKAKPESKPAFLGPAASEVMEGPVPKPEPALKSNADAKADSKTGTKPEAAPAGS